MWRAVASAVVAAALLCGWGAEAQLYDGGEEVVRRLVDFARHEPYQTAADVGQRLREAWPWLKYVGWPWVNELVDLDAGAWASAARQSSIGEQLDAACQKLQDWKPDEVNVDCVESIRFLGCDFLHYVKAGLTDCEGECGCEERKSKTLAQGKWATNVVDAFGKLPSAVLQGNFLWMGDWDSCHATGVEAIRSHNDSEGRPFRYEGHYCTLSASQAVGKAAYVKEACGASAGSGAAKVGHCRESAAKVHYGICAPRTCSTEDLNTVAKTLSSAFDIHLCGVDVTCQDPAQIADHPESIAFAVFFGLLGLVLLLATVFDEVVYAPAIQHLPDKAPPPAQPSPDNPDPAPAPPAPMTKAQYYEELSWYLKSLLCFSMTRNLEKIMSTEVREGQLGVVHSIRVLSMFWVILGHCYLMALGYEDNVSVMVALPKNFLFEVVNNATLSVDSFFLLSGFLLSYLFLKRAAVKPGQLKSPGFWVLYYVHRFVRLSPPYFLVLAAISTIWPLVGSGPLWKGFSHEYIRSCGTVSVLTNLFYVNNLVRVGEQCMGWTWYLANDMQFYCLAPPLLVLLHFYPGVGLGVAAALLLLSAVLRAVFVVLLGYPPTVINTVDTSVFAKANEYFNQFYIRPYFRYAPFVIGLVLGWAYLRAERRKLRLHPWLRLGGWASVAALSFGVVFGLFHYANLPHAADLSDTAKALYNGLNRSVFAVAVAGAVFLCLPAGPSGLVDSAVRCVLQWPGWQPLSRLTYCAYLVHPMVIMFFYGRLKNPEHLSDYNMFYVFLSTVATSYALAAVCSLAFEAPLMGLDRLWLDPRQWRSSAASTGMGPVRDKLGEVKFRLQEGLRSLHNSANDLRPAVHQDPLPDQPNTQAQALSMAELSAKEAMAEAVPDSPTSPAADTTALTDLTTSQDTQNGSLDTSLPQQA